MLKVFCALFAIFLLPGCGVVGAFIPPIRVYDQKMDGEAELAKANYSKQVAVQEAQAKLDSAKLLAQAEVERAKGVALANAIIGDSLKNNEAYLRWLYIEGLKEKSGDQVIYIPTEAGLPILEAGRRTHPGKNP